MKEIFAGALRHLISALGGAAVLHNLISADDSQKAAGAVAILFAILWSAIQKYQSQRALAEKGK